VTKGGWCMLREQQEEARRILDAEKGGPSGD
jgi:hypothetical protein